MPRLNSTLPITFEDRTMSQHFRDFMTLLSNQLPIVGSGPPEGNVEAPLYSLYIDDVEGAGAITYRKMLAFIGNDRSMGWILVGGVGSGVVSHDQLQGVTADQHHDQVHDAYGPDHDPPIDPVPTPETVVPFSQYVASQLNIEDMPDGTTVTDELTANTWTLSGDATISSGRMLFDGTGDYMTHTHRSAFLSEFDGAHSFLWTIEFKFKVGAVTTLQQLIDWRSSGTTVGLIIQQTASDEIRAAFGDSIAGYEVDITSTATVSVDDEVEVCIMWARDFQMLFVNGVFEGKGIAPAFLDLGFGGLIFGIDDDLSTAPLTGELIRMRFTRQAARYMAEDYTVEAGDSYAL